MGKLEKKIQKKNLQRIILSSVASLRIMGVGLLAPNVIGALGKLGLISNKRQREYIGSSASKMVKKGLLKYNGKFYELTSLGREQLRMWEFADFRFKKPKRWDNKWRVIIFDIPEKKRRVRDQIRHLFNKSGMYRLQDSVWVYPYDCEDILTLLKSDLGVGKDILYLIVDELENDKHLRQFFSVI